MALRIAHHDLYDHPLPANHRFPMAKYTLIPEQLRYEGIANEDHFFAPEKVEPELILQTHTAHYWHKLNTLQLSRQEERRTGFPLSRRLVDRELTITQGTVEGAEWALQGGGCAMNVAGGTHHAYTDRGEGFCLLNDQAVAARYLLNAGLASSILIVDLDVHQGQGTAEIFYGEHRVFTFSMHGKDNYPMKKETSDLDLPLESGTQDGTYLDLLYETLPRLIDRQQPDFVFYLAGVDPLHTDKLGRLALSADGLRRRDQFVLETLWQKGLPVQISMGGGYSPRLADIVNAHCATFRQAQLIYG